MRMADVISEMSALTTNITFSHLTSVRQQLSFSVLLTIELLKENVSFKIWLPLMPIFRYHNLSLIFHILY